MKQVIAFLRPSLERDSCHMEWWYFCGFTHEDINVNPPREEITINQQLSKAYVFDEDRPMLLHTVMQRLKTHHGHHMFQTFAVSDKRLFEARLKGE